MSDYEVIVAGGGPVGLGLAIELGQRGVSVLVVERFHSRLEIPKGQNMTQRTAEHFRAWNTVAEMRAAAPVQRAKATTGATAYGTLISDYSYEWLKRGSVDAYYAERAVRMPQYNTEFVLRDRVEALSNVRVIYDWSVEDLTQNANGVSVTLQERDGDAQQTFTGQYLVGCDGAWSTVREKAGIEQAIDARDKRMILTVVKAPRLTELVDTHYPGMDFFNVLNPKLEGYWQFLGRVNMEDDWFFHMPVPHDTTQENADIKGLLNAAIGEEFDLTVKYLGFWDLRFAQAKTYRAGRIFIAGDAGHAHPPYGGYGVNSGFEDVRNLGWKLAAKLQGWGSDALLDSYTEERHPVFASTRDDFIAKMIDLDAAFTAEFSPEKDKDAFDAAWAERSKPQSEVMQFVPNYAGSSIVVGEGTPSARGAHSFAAEAGYHLAPATLDDGSNIFNHLGSNFALIIRDTSNLDASALRNAADAQGISLKVIPVAASQEVNRWGAEAILVRPDHFLAYAGAADGDALADALLSATGNKVTENV
ncbi:FAD-dependent monooxygenase [Cognatishimia sp.]|uniref:FAD-dependent monooxygenase n=1 Tax=Cognatishimia sp. TaxID=2211648 RepID=UPI0035158D28|nr:FAD-dependent monooxygenase [Cognatishimia sp.]